MNSEQAIVVWAWLIETMLSAITINSNAELIFNLNYEIKDEIYKW